MPLPGSGLRVRAKTAISSEADYHLRLGMPLADDTVGIDSDEPTCQLEVTITSDHSSPITSNIESFKANSEFGFGNIRFYASRQFWHLSGGTYTIEIASKAIPDEIARRGAILSLERHTRHTTERFLDQLLTHWIGVIVSLVGLVGLTVCEVIHPRK